MFQLKKSAPAFEAMSGPLAGRKFEHGRSYLEVPEADASRFERVPGKEEAEPEAKPEAESKTKAKPAKKRAKKPAPFEDADSFLAPGRNGAGRKKGGK